MSDDKVPQPVWSPLWLTCKACGYQWDDWQPIGVPLATWVAHIRTIRCRTCGGRKSIFLRSAPLSD